MAGQAFDRVGETFIAYYDQLRGHVRQEITRANLARHLADSTLKILDVGGGDGRDAIWLAKQGHSVTLIDPAQKMIDKAKRQLEDTPYEDQVEAIYGDPEEVLADTNNDNGYDVALSHGVLPYLLEEGAPAHLSLLSRVTRLNGIVSILTKGKAGSLQRLMNQGDIDAAIRLEETGHMSNNLGEEVVAATSDSMVTMLATTALKLDAWYGVRLVTDNDFRAWEKVPYAQLQTLLAIETRLSRDSNTKGMAQMLHFLARKQ